MFVLDALVQSDAGQSCHFEAFCVQFGHFEARLTGLHDAGRSSYDLVKQECGLGLPILLVHVQRSTDVQITNLQTYQLDEQMMKISNPLY